jgi:hypothetical protein
MSCRRHCADMSACLSFLGEKIPDTTPTFPAKIHKIWYAQVTDSLNDSPEQKKNLIIRGHQYDRLDSF